LLSGCAFDGDAVRRLVSTIAIGLWWTEFNDARCINTLFPDRVLNVDVTVVIWFDSLRQGTHRTPWSAAKRKLSLLKSILWPGSGLSAQVMHHVNVRRTGRRSETVTEIVSDCLSSKRISQGKATPG
jgi:hypothetical protein